MTPNNRARRNIYREGDRDRDLERDRESQDMTMVAAAPSDLRNANVKTTRATERQGCTCG